MANSLEIDSSFIVSFLMFLLFNKTEILFALPFFFSEISHLTVSLSELPSQLPGAQSTLEPVGVWEEERGSGPLSCLLPHTHEWCRGHGTIASKLGATHFKCYNIYFICFLYTPEIHAAL